MHYFAFIYNFAKTKKEENRNKSNFSHRKLSVANAEKKVNHVIKTDHEKNLLILSFFNILAIS